jgi:hypothetical protein
MVRPAILYLVPEVQELVFTTLKVNIGQIYRSLNYRQLIHLFRSHALILLTASLDRPPISISD